MNSVKSVQESNYKRLEDLGIVEKIRKCAYLKYKKEGMMDLHIDFLSRVGEELIVSIAHNGKQNGDVMADPDMELKIDLANRTVEAMSFRNDYVGINHQVYRFEGNGNVTGVREKLRKELNYFLEEWLASIEFNDYKLDEEEYF